MFKGNYPIEWELEVVGQKDWKRESDARHTEQQGRRPRQVIELSFGVPPAVCGHGAKLANEDVAVANGQVSPGRITRHAILLCEDIWI